MCNPNPMLLREKLGFEGYHPMVRSCFGSKVYGESVSDFPTSFKVGIFTTT